MTENITNNSANLLNRLWDEKLLRNFCNSINESLFSKADMKKNGDFVSIEKNVQWVLKFTWEFKLDIKSVTQSYFSGKISINYQWELLLTIDSWTNSLMFMDNKDNQKFGVLKYLWKVSHKVEINKSMYKKLEKERPDLINYINLMDKNYK